MLGSLRKWLDAFLRADSPQSMTRAMMAVGGASIFLVSLADAGVLAAVAYRVWNGLELKDPSAPLLASATVIGALAAFAWGQARERSKAPAAPDAPPARPTQVVGQVEG